MANLVVDTFGGWCGTSTTIWATRYNTTNPAVSMSPSGGRFNDGCMIVAGNNFARVNLRATITPTIRIGVALFATDWSLGSATGPVITILGDAAGGQCYLSVDGATKRFQFRNFNNTLLGTGTLVLQNNSWYFVEILITIGNANGAVSLQVDGVADITLTNVDNQNLATTNITGYHLRGLVGGFTRFGSLFTADAGPLQGDSRVFLLTPTADGAASAWTPSTGTALFSLVDEIPPTDDTDYISSATATQQALFGFSDLPYTPAVVYAVQVSLYARKDDAAARSIATLVRSGGTTATGATQVLTTSYLDFYLQIYDLNPVTAAAWTGSEVDAMEAGVECVA